MGDGSVDKKLERLRDALLNNLLELIENDRANANDRGVAQRLLQGAAMFEHVEEPKGNILKAVPFTDPDQQQTG